MVKDAIKKTRRAASPWGIDADGWRCVLISGNFTNLRQEFRKSIAEMTKRLCQERSADYLATFLARRLIRLEMQPGVRPTGIGEVLSRVIKNTAMKLLRKYLLKATGSPQFCAGQDAGSETAIHAV